MTVYGQIGLSKAAGSYPDRVVRLIHDASRQ
jgi:hypothetical protein